MVGRYGYARRVVAGAAVSVLAAVALPALGAGWRTHILGPADSLPMDQPWVDIAIEDPAYPDFPIFPAIEGPTTKALLDTGANGVLLAQPAYTVGYDIDWEVWPPQFVAITDVNQFVHQTRGDGSLVYYHELGVGGTQPFLISQPYNVRLSEYGGLFGGGGGTLQVLPNVKFLGDPNLVLGMAMIDEMAGVVGMPAMMGRITQFDLMRMADPYEPMNLGVVFPATTPPAPAGTTSYHVPLQILPAEFVPPEQPGDPQPTYAGLPMVRDVEIQAGGHITRATLILDTGAQTTIISRQLAGLLGINPDRDWVEELPVGGVGGTTIMKMVMVNRLSIPTQEGVLLAMTGLEVGVLDIAGIDGVIGMNVLTSSMNQWFNGEMGYFGNIVLDLTDPDHGTLRLDTNVLFDQEFDPATALPGDANLDGAVNEFDLEVLMRTLGQVSLYRGTGDEGFPAAAVAAALSGKLNDGRPIRAGRWPGNWTDGDFNGDGLVDLMDLTLLARNFTPLPDDGGWGAVVPEPGSFAVLAAGMLGLGRRRRQSSRR